MEGREGGDVVIKISELFLHGCKAIIIIKCNAFTLVSHTDSERSNWFIIFTEDSLLSMASVTENFFPSYSLHSNGLNVYLGGRMLIY